MQMESDLEKNPNNPFIMPDSTLMPKTLILTGTCGTAWHRLAKQLAPASMNRIEQGVLPTGTGPFVLSQLNPSFPDFLISNEEIRVVAFCEPPAEFLAAELHGCEEPAWERALNAWCESAEALLALWRKNRGRVDLFDLDECSECPQEFLEWFQKKTAMCVASSLAWPEVRGEDYEVHRRVISECLVKEHRASERLWREIQTARQPLSSGFPAYALIPSALQSLKRLAKAESMRRALVAERSTLDPRLSTLTAESDELATVRESLSADLQKQKEQSLQTHEMLLTEIHSAHLESEGFFEEWKTLEAVSDYHQLKVGAVSRGDEKSTPTHSHLDFSFERLELLDRRWPRLAVRLVEHKGHAGIALFDSPTETTRPLFHWKPLGIENGSGYMLFVPTDKPALESLVALPATDLVLLQCLTARILGHLSVHDESSPARWTTVARRLLQQIEEIPERLHYDSVSATPAIGGKTIDFTLSHLDYRGTLMESFCWTWKPGPAGGELQLHKAEAFTSVLMAWPVEQEARCVGLETREVLEQTSLAWSQLLERDRTFLRLLATAHQDFVIHLCDQHSALLPVQDELAKQASALAKNFRNFALKNTTKKKKLLSFLGLLP